MASSHGADRISARRDLGDNPRLVLIAPCPPPPGAGKHLQPADWLRDSTMFSVHSKPSGQNQTADSQISTSSGRWPQNTAYGIVTDCAPDAERTTVRRRDLFFQDFKALAEQTHWLVILSRREMRSASTVASTAFT